MSSILSEDLGEGGILAVTNLEASVSAWCCVFRVESLSQTGDTSLISHPDT